MGTRSTIAMVNEDGSVSQIYCHWDGYLSNNGKILLENYETAEKVKELIALGSLSVLGETIGKKIDFDGELPSGQCRAYHRDRDEDLQIYQYKNITDYKLNGCMEGYDYIFIDGKWQVQLWEKPFVDLAYAIAFEEAEELLHE